MFKLKIKRADQQSITTKCFKTLQEVAEHIAIICNASNLAEVLKAQKEFNYRFYISYSKNY